MVAMGSEKTQLTKWRAACAATSGSSIAALRLMSSTGMARAAGAIHRADPNLGDPRQKLIPLLEGCSGQIYVVH
jgi:hypothetical protein